MTWENKSALRRRGFTLLELMMVIALIAIMFAVMIPLTSASSRERKLRTAAEQIEGMVRAQRNAAQDDGHRRILEISSRGFFEHGGKRDQVLGMTGAQTLYVRYPGAKWEKPAKQIWEFSPVGMVTPLSVRLEQGDAWIEVDFDMLTGRVAEERYAF
ncbi:MAG: pilus assembly FimT family protein [Chthoniobacterales bacterium]